MGGDFPQLAPPGGVVEAANSENACQVSQRFQSSGCKSNGLRVDRDFRTKDSFCLPSIVLVSS